MKTLSENTLLVHSTSVLEVVRIYRKDRISIFYNHSAEVVLLRYAKISSIVCRRTVVKIDEF